GENDRPISLRRRQEPPRVLPHPPSCLGPATLVARRHALRGHHRRLPHPKHFLDQRRESPGHPPLGQCPQHRRNPDHASTAPRVAHPLRRLLPPEGSPSQNLRRLSR